MKSKILALALFVFTAAGVVFYPIYQSTGATNAVTSTTSVLNALNQKRSSIEVVFVLDTTGSMSGLIRAAKEKIWSIASTMASAQSAPEIRMGLVGYRDRGDAYVTKILDLSTDLDSMYARLMDFQADGGGDGPESVNQALYDAVHSMSWSQDQNTYRVVFLVGDAPPHMDYQDDVKYPDTLAVALKKGIVVNAIQCGQNKATTKCWQQIARLGEGRYFQVDQAGDAVAISTPFDEKIARLSKQLDDTRLYYGDAEEKAKQQAKLDATDKLHAASSLASRARRAVFNASKGGESNFLGESELVDDIASGRVELSDIDKEQLPETMKTMAPAQQQALIEETAQLRDQLQRQIRDLSEKRSSFLQKKVAEAGGAEDSLDEKIYSAIRDQAGKAQLRYEADSAAY